jgi:hypothetical protein
MDVAEDTCDESPRLRVLIDYGTYRWAIRLTAAMSMILRFGLVEGGGR